jgi:hypothetical protein
MKTIKKRVSGVWALGLVMLMAAPSAAQDKYNNSSVYSALGVGLPIDFRSSQGASMGISGVSIMSRLHGNLSNPALWSGSYFTMANGGLAFNTYDSRDDFGSAVNSQFTINHFQLQFPIYRERLGVSISMQPITESRYTVINNVTLLPTSADADTLLYESFKRGDGGLNRLEAGLGYALSPNISIGYAASLVFGVQKVINEVTFANAGYTPVTYTERTSSVGLGNRFGVYAQYGKLFNQDDIIALGVSTSLPVNLNATRDLTSTISTIDVTIRPESDYGDGNMRLPLEVVAGISYYPNRLVHISSEVLMQNWSDFQNFAGQSEEFYTDRVKFGLGFEYAAFRRTESTLFTRFNYRAGISLDSGNLSLNNQQIETVLFSFGLGIPSPAAGSSVDVGLDFGIRGTTSHELVRERIFALKVSFNLSELMFLQRRLQ